MFSTCGSAYAPTGCSLIGEQPLGSSSNQLVMYYKSDVKSRGLFTRQGFLQITVYREDKDPLTGGCADICMEI